MIMCSDADIRIITQPPESSADLIDILDAIKNNRNGISGKMKYYF